MIENININGVVYDATPVEEGQLANGRTMTVDGVTYLLTEQPQAIAEPQAATSAIEKVNVNGVVYDIRDVEDVAAENARAMAAEQELEEKIDNIPHATTENAGLMSAEDKKKVDAAIIAVPSRNIFDCNDKDIMIGYYQGSGSITASTSYNLTGYIPVEPGKTYHIGHISANDVQARFVSYFNSAKTNLGGATQSVAVFTVPDNAAYVRLSLFANKSLDGYMVEEGDTYTGYVQYGDKYDLSPTLGTVEKLEKVYPAISQIGEIVDIVEEVSVEFYLGASGNKTIYQHAVKSDNCTLTITLKNLVGSYLCARVYYSGTYIEMQKRYDGSYFASKSFIGMTAGEPIQIKMLTNATQTGSVDENCVIEIVEQSNNSVIRPRVDIYITDSQLQVFEKMLYANNIGHCDVFFQPGTYSFDETLFDWMRQERMSGRAELPIGGGCRYFLNGATLSASYNGEDSIVEGNCNVVGCGNTAGNFELHDGTIIANDIIYAVHDDCGQSGRGDSHIHKYHNMHIVYNGGTKAAGKAICKCVGGGTCGYASHLCHSVHNHHARHILYR